MYPGSSPENLTVPEAGSPVSSAVRQTRSSAPLSDGRFTVSLSTCPSPSRMITKTPSRASSSTSSPCRVSPERMLLAALTARLSAVFSMFESRASLSKKKSATPRTRSIAPIARAMNSVRRQRMGKCSRPPQGVARSTHGADELLLPRGVHLSPEVADVDVHKVGCQAELLVPNAREEEISGEHPAGVPGHKLQQFVLAGG